MPWGSTAASCKQLCFWYGKDRKYVDADRDASQVTGLWAVLDAYHHPAM